MKSENTSIPLPGVCRQTLCAFFTRRVGKWFVALKETGELQARLALPTAAPAPSPKVSQQEKWQLSRSQLCLNIPGWRQTWRWSLCLFHTTFFCWSWFWESNIHPSPGSQPRISLQALIPSLWILSKEVSLVSLTLVSQKGGKQQLGADGECHYNREVCLRQKWGYIGLAFCLSVSRSTLGDQVKWSVIFFSNNAGVF